MDRILCVAQTCFDEVKPENQQRATWTQLALARQLIQETLRRLQGTLGSSALTGAFLSYPFGAKVATRTRLTLSEPQTPKALSTRASFSPRTRSFPFLGRTAFSPPTRSSSHTSRTMLAPRVRRPSRWRMCESRAAQRGISGVRRAFSKFPPLDNVLTFLPSPCAQSAAPSRSLSSRPSRSGLARRVRARPYSPTRLTRPQAPSFPPMAPSGSS